MDPSSSNKRPSGIPRPSRLPVLKPIEANKPAPNLRYAASTERLRPKTSRSSLTKPSSSVPSISPHGTRRVNLNSATSNPTKKDDNVFKKPIGRPSSRQAISQSRSSQPKPSKEDDELGDLDSFRVSSRQSIREEDLAEMENGAGTDGEFKIPRSRKPRPSLSDRTIESLSQIPPSPAGRRRKSSFFTPESLMGSSRPTSAMGNTRRPGTMTPLGDGSELPPFCRSTMTAPPGKRSISDALARKNPSRPNIVRETPRSRILGSKSMAARPSMSRPTKKPTTTRLSNKLPSTQQIAQAKAAPPEADGFDFELASDPFNLGSNGGKELLNSRIDAARREGRLNISAMGLIEIPSEVMTMYTYDPTAKNSSSWAEVVDLVRLNAADNDIEVISDETFPDQGIGTFNFDDEVKENIFGGVEHIDFHGNKLSQIPMGMRRLMLLSSLNLSRNQLSVTAFDVLTQIENLKELRLAENKIDGPLPKSIGDMRKLEVLELQGNSITDLPDSLQELIHLRVLDIGKNKLITLPVDAIRKLPLVELKASKNRLSGVLFPQDIELPSLQTLSLSNNNLESLCGSADLILPKLTCLDICSNGLRSFPDVSSWASLVIMIVQDNDLSELPEGFCTLQTLKGADFTGNNITKLDERMALMDGLEQLRIEANPLRERKFLTMSTEDIKRDLRLRLERDNSTVTNTEDIAGVTPHESNINTNSWTLKPSGILDLSSQSLQDLDTEQVNTFFTTNTVRQLILRNNAFPSIPPSLVAGTSISTLDLSSNAITTALHAPLTLPNLRDLNLQNNHLVSLSRLTTYLSAPSLTHLNISNNRITGPLPILPPVFPNLCTLIAADNNITEAPAEALEGLASADLSNNDIARLDPRIGLLEGRLTSLGLEGNLFRVPGRSVLGKGTEAVLRWCRDKIPEGGGVMEGGSMDGFGGLKLE
ncbi:L domain-like protein [Patellaria atrata CBS 101060]|uniref:L domain-like protein n=1 Tax=Patellaria atrata CBS 101060 TaxID=1346257 RepID=A0A9P4SK27_9PEZI|nr:L domain-like protein [Patellaria atrata CBS 101060]